ncbi:CheR family methyltransferase [Hyphomonas sp.]|uniref:CheR family methyltransferase n=1 Tax=Hyphomonas sp. TaxID=87 RepID=UPI003919C066
MQETVFHALADLALKSTGQAIPLSRAYLMEARLAPIARREGFGSLADLVHCLEARQNPVFRTEVAAALLTHETSFFRERAVYDTVIDTVMPERLSAPGASARLRVWCAGGSTGQEAYSLAMMLEDEPSALLRAARIEIVSTDFCKASTERARAGVYNHYEIQKGLSIRRLIKHFGRLESGDWQASDALKGRVGFRQHNLMESAGGLGQFDVIFCRHVLSGMARSARVRVAEVLAAQMAPGAVILLGEGESFQGLTDLLEPAGDIRQGWVAAGTANRRAA